MPISPEDAARRLRAAHDTLSAKINGLLEKAAVMVETEAKRVLGTYDYGWPRLKPETVVRKATGDSPLLETGELRASIHHSVDQAAHEAYVGSDNPKARWHELGTVRIPARSFLLGAGMAKRQEIIEMTGLELQMHIMGKGEPIASAIEREERAAPVKPTGEVK